ncbi:hypothetical protein THIOM_002720 [Candidatus Thiomargarita nelsonii]|uniref:Uncharacterized protein n=1 Tax=Candidatus Thiomargarita nelsonii TaxID=1003181 RepID=A0A176S0Q1_9GAMM|nr:hypothetical protein THIOM_002720 [Candidatus Thiomargarita nelsonii]
MVSPITKKLVDKITVRRVDLHAIKLRLQCFCRALPILIDNTRHLFCFQSSRRNKSLETFIGEGFTFRLDCGRCDR